ncbi:MAG: hypothetical protein Tsb0013_08590 [Phycisphaerales bacterium]
MFETLNAPDHVVGVRLSGLMTGKDIQYYRRHLDRALATGEPFALCVDLSGVEDIDHDAMTKGAAADFELLRHLDQITRIALVSNKHWPHEIVRVIGMILPDLEVRVFPVMEREAALAWAGAYPKALASDRHRSIRVIETDADEVLAFEWNGTVTNDDLEPVLDRLRTFLEGHEKVRLLSRIRRYGIDPTILLHSGLISVKLAAMEKVERYAIVGAPTWIERAVAFMDPLFPDIDMRTFPAHREDEAWAWIGAHERKHELAAH